MITGKSMSSATVRVRGYSSVLSIEVCYSLVFCGHQIYSLGIRINTINRERAYLLLIDNLMEVCLCNICGYFEVQKINCIDSLIQKLNSIDVLRSSINIIDFMCFLYSSNY